MSGDAKNAGSWETDPRWQGVRRTYSAVDVDRLGGTVRVEHTLARLGAERLWDLMRKRDYVPRARGAHRKPGHPAGAGGARGHLLQRLAGGGRRQRGGRDVSRPEPLSRRQRAQVVERINNALLRADQIQHAEGTDGPYWFAPIVADAEAGFGGNLNAFELMKA